MQNHLSQIVQIISLRSLGRLSFLILYFAFPVGAQEIALVRPKEGDLIPRFAQNIIVSGNVGKTGLKEIWINNQQVSVYRTGSFMAYLPISSSSNSFAFNVATAATLAPVLSRAIRFEPKVAEGALERILNSLEPKASSIEMQGGESLVISFQAPEKGEASFKVQGVTGKKEMEEVKEGLYQASVTVTPGDLKDKELGGELVLFFEDNQGKSYKVETKKTVRFAKIGHWPKLVKSSALRAKVLSSPVSGSYWFSVSSATLLQATGMVGNLYRLRLAGSLNAWVDKEDVNSVKSFPRSSLIETMEVVESTGSSPETWVRVGFRGPKVPFLVEEESKDHLRLRLFNSKMHLNWIPYRPADQVSLVESVAWNIPQEDEVDFEIKLKTPALWGYWAEATNNGVLLRLRHERTASLIGPVAASNPAKKSVNPYKPWLLGKRVLLDPGHGGKDEGALAPSGINESQANLGLALAVAKKLQTLGAEVTLTRSTTDQTLALEDRVAQAKDLNPDFFVSIHCNDFANWVNPFEGGPWGYSTYYYHSNSLALARSLENELNKADLSGIPESGTLWGDLYLLRELTIPVVLVESGYLAFPWQEELLLTDGKFREKYAAAAAKALERYAMGKF